MRHCQNSLMVRKSTHLWRRKRQRTEGLLGSSSFQLTFEESSECKMEIETLADERVHGKLLLLDKQSSNQKMQLSCCWTISIREYDQEAAEVANADTWIMTNIMFFPPKQRGENEGRQKKINRLRTKGIIWMFSICSEPHLSSARLHLSKTGFLWIHRTG